MIGTETNKNKIMNFNEFNTLIQKRFDYLQGNYVLLRSSVTGDELWETYLKSFKPGDDPVFRDPNSTSHTCNNDKNFIRRYGNIVGINDKYEILSMFELNLDKSDVYYQPTKAMNKLLTKSKIENVFFETFDELNSLPYEKITKKNTRFQLGSGTNYKQYTKEEVEKYGVVELNKVYSFDHFHVFLNKYYVDMSGKSVDAIMGGYRDSKNVFKRGLDEIPLDTFILVRDLIKQGSLLNGEAHLFKLDAIIPLKKEYDNISSELKDNWSWFKSYNLSFSKFKNEVIGTLCSDLAEGMELNEACKTWNKRVDPVNYMKAKSPITQKQIKEAQKFVEEMSYGESFDRRFATLDDININEILHSNIGKGDIKTASIFDSVQPSKTSRHKKSQFDGIEEVTIDKFMKDILPNCTSVEAFMENRFQGNLVSLITSNDKTAKSIFKWHNPFSWTYNGNLTGKSLIKDAVKEKGGKVDGVLRFSIMWGEDDPTDNSDLDAWCTLPNKSTIGYSTSYRKDRGNTRNMSGQLDVDITSPNNYDNKNIVENIAFIDLNDMKDGKYSFHVNMYSNRGSKGFKAEVEFDGEIYRYEYNSSWSGNKGVAEVTLKDGKFTIEHKLPEINQSKKYWNLDTNEFHKVNLVCQSPNYWGENNTGNKHYFFMLDKCKSDVSLRSFHNEYLNSDLLSHRKVMEVLANTTTIEPSENQLSGLGFNSTVKDELIVKVTGSFKRTLKIKF
jgi:hypothetical protein